MDFKQIEQESSHLIKSHKKDLPGSHANSHWHSSFGLPLTHTSLRVYLPVDREKTLLNDLPVAQMEKQYFKEAMKVSHMQGLLDSRALNTFINQTRRGEPPPGCMDQVIMFSPSQASPRRVRRPVRGRCITATGAFTATGAEYDIFSPESEPQSASAPVDVRHPPTEVSGKIGVDPLRKPQRRRRPELSSKIGSQEASEKQGGTCRSRPPSVAIATPRRGVSKESAAAEAIVQRVQTPAKRMGPMQTCAVGSLDGSALASSLPSPRLAPPRLEAPRLAPPLRATSGGKSSRMPSAQMEGPPPMHLSSVVDSPMLTMVSSRKAASGTGTASYVPLDSKHLPWPRPDKNDS